MNCDIWNRIYVVLIMSEHQVVLIEDNRTESRMFTVFSFEYVRHNCKLAIHVFKHAVKHLKLMLYLVRCTQSCGSVYFDFTNKF